MKKIYKPLIALFFVLGITSCNLNREPYGISNFWNTEEDVQLALNAAYQPFYEEEGFGRGQFWADASDDIYMNRQNDDETRLLLFKTGVNNVGGLFDNWQLMYRSIRRANDVLQHAPEIVTKEADRDLIMGEANFICGFCYFFLAKRYGGVPFYDLNKAINGGYSKPEDFLEPRQTKTETYTRIANYLKTSVQLFEAAGKADNKQDIYHREGRPNWGAAYGLLAKVYAYWGKYAEAKQYSDLVINSGQYELDKTGTNGYAHLFSPAGEKDFKEVLFNLGNKNVRHQASITSIVLLSGHFTHGAGWYYFAPTKGLYKSFAQGDTRRKVTMVGVGDTVNYLGNQLVLSKDTISDMQTGYMCAKYSAAYNNLKSWDWESGADVPLLRYADVLLINAEANIFLGGGGPKNPTNGVAAAAQSFNQVRVRAFGNDPSYAIAAPSFNDLVNERRCELAYEDSRHFDLVRWGIAKDVYANPDADDHYGKRDFDPTANAAFPLPQQEIDNTNNILINNPNPGYSDFN